MHCFSELDCFFLVAMYAEVSVSRKYKTRRSAVLFLLSQFICSILSKHPIHNTIFHLSQLIHHNGYLRLHPFLYHFLHWSSRPDGKHKGHQVRPHLPFPFVKQNLALICKDLTHQQPLHLAYHSTGLSVTLDAQQRA